MPIFDQGYQHWEGSRIAHFWRWTTIARQGVRAQLKNRWIWIVLIVALVPALVLTTFVVLWGLLEQQSALIAPFMAMLRGLPSEILDGPKAFRVTMWTIAFQRFFSVQLFFTFVLVLLVGPGLISQDLRFNALPLYLSRPLRRIDYFLGKLGVIAIFLTGVTVLPPLLAYVFGVCFSMDFSIIKDTWRILLTSLCFGLIVVFSAGTFMLALSSLSRNTRIVSVMWCGFWILSAVMGEHLTQLLKQDWCQSVSYSNCLARVNQLMLDSDGAEKRIGETFRKAREMAAAMPPGMAFGQAQHGKARPKSATSVPPPQQRRRNRDVPPTPWYWPTSILLGLLGLSACILTFRVKSLDRLR